MENRNQNNQSYNPEDPLYDPEGEKNVKPILPTRVWGKKLKNFRQNKKLSSLQKQVLVAILLGDGNLSTNDGGKTYRLTFSQSESHKDYLEHVYSIFQEFCFSPPKRVYREIVFPQNKHNDVGKTPQVSYKFRTISLPCFRFYAHQFYPKYGKKYKSGIGIKRVPKSIKQFLTARSMAYWFMDDGSQKSKQSKAVIFNTQGFKKEDVEMVCKVLDQKFQLQAKPRQQPSGYPVYISGKSYQRVRELIFCMIDGSMVHKFPLERKI